MASFYEYNIIFDSASKWRLGMSDLLLLQNRLAKSELEGQTWWKSWTKTSCLRLFSSLSSSVASHSQFRSGRVFLLWSQKAQDCPLL